MKRKWLYAGVAVLGMIALVIFGYVLPKENQDTETQFTTESDNTDKIVYIPLEEVSEITGIENEKLIEVTDKDVIEKFSNTIPDLSSLIKKSIASKDVATKIFSVFIPKKDTLASTRNVMGTTEGFVRGKNGVLSYKSGIDISAANFVKVSSATNLATLGVQLIMEVQMNEIKSSLTSIEETVNKISEFQEREFTSRIKTLSSDVLEISKYSDEIMQDDEARSRKMESLDELKNESKQLLNQVNLNIKGVINENTEKYENYQNKTNEISQEQNVQNILINVLNEISKLTYFLGQGKTSADLSYEAYNSYQEEVTEINTAVKEWQEIQIERLNIDLKKGQRAKSGVEGLVSKEPSLIDEKWKYEKMDVSVLNEIKKQCSPIKSESKHQNELFDTDVTMIVKGGRLYYLNNSEE
ncbi:hypothetical protein [Enterococcus asini]|uniref:hypothetical protein n=1 Tax=Enterococcus asini TaxID=57732 RepID=UPI00266D5024|nr:hypothetical protein [Enterococcus asini]